MYTEIFMAEKYNYQPKKWDSFLSFASKLCLCPILLTVLTSTHNQCSEVKLSFNYISI